MGQRWLLVKHEMDKECPTVRELAKSFDRTNMSTEWTGWAYNSSYLSTIPTDSQVIESWHNAVKANSCIKTNRVSAAQVRPVTVTNN